MVLKKRGFIASSRHEYSHILTCHADIDPEGPLEQTAAFIKQEIESDLTESAVCLQGRHALQLCSSAD